MKEPVLFSLFMVFYYIIYFVPDKIDYYIGIGLGKLIYFLLKSRREVTLANLRRALGSNYSEEGLVSLCKKVYQQMGLTFVEFIMTDNLGKDLIESSIEIEGLNYLKEAYQQGKGVIVYTAHFGNWERLGSVISQLGYPVNAIARTQDNVYFDRKINKIRSSQGINIIPKGISVRKVYKVLKGGELLFILGDQNARKKGWQIDFFGIPASTYPGVVQLARRTGSVILPAFLLREEWGKHRLVIKKPYSISKDASKDAQQELLQELTGVIEAEIRKKPAQWFWPHRRWKR
ncbi:MAG: lysophospholipid acyltransferase family protein [Firmicutes bacterium]|nr:lysophospholipid acyltransferase family protein [Bacillota bacterium]